MSCDSYMQKVSSYILEKMKSHPCVVDLFFSAHTLNNFSNDFWKGIEEEQEEWEMIDEDLGKQKRITKSIYKKLLPDIPQIIEEGLSECLHVGHRDCFDWIKADVEISPTEIGNERYYDKALYQTASQVKVLARKLRELQEKKGYVDAYQVFYSDPSILPTESKAQEYFNEALFFCQQAAEKDCALLLYLG